MHRRRPRPLLFVVALVASALPWRLVAQTPPRAPETVIITLHAKAGFEAALAEVIARHYETADRLRLLASPAPHLTLRGVDERGGTVFTEILTWRDDEAPDNAPPEIQSIWKEMNALVDQQNGRPALTIAPVQVIGK